MKSIEWDISFWQFTWRFSATHLIAYFVAGVLADLFFNYGEVFQSSEYGNILRPYDDPWIAAGLGLQLMNGFLLSLFLYPMKYWIIAPPHGFRNLILVILGFSLFHPQIPGPGTLEGVFYLSIPFQEHLLGLPELIIYALTMTFGFYRWNQSHNRIWGISSTILVVIILLLSLLAYAHRMGWLPE
jgi:hypothetical protein